MNISYSRNIDCLFVFLDVGLFNRLLNRGKTHAEGQRARGGFFLRECLWDVFYGNRVAYRLSTLYATPLMIHHPLRVLRGFAGDFCYRRIGPGIIQPGKNSRRGAEGSRRMFLGEGVLTGRFSTEIHHPLRVLRGFA